jgi:hypothetical protein
MIGHWGLACRMAVAHGARGFGDTPADPSPARGPRDALRLIATVGSPIAIGTGPLFYFGWVRASVQAERLGYDTSILDWSIQDYILRSINVLYIPLVALLLLMLLLVWLHQRLVVPRLEDKKLAWVPGGLKASWIGWVLAAALLVAVVPPLRRVAIPVCLTLALLCALYGEALERQINKQARMALAAMALILVLLAFAVFWDAERVARTIGEGWADDIAANPRQLVAVTIYSPKDLEIDARGVVETRLTEPDSAYRYRYDGFRLLQRSGDRYLLISELWDAGSRRVIVLRDTDAIRMEFSR